MIQSISSFPQNPPKSQTVNLPYEQAVELAKLGKKSATFAKQNDALIKENTHLKKTQFTLAAQLEKTNRDLKAANLKINKYEQWGRYALIAIVVMVIFILVRIFR